MVDIQVPAPHIRNTHVMATQLRRLHIPDNILAICVLITNFHQRCGHTIHPLPVNVQSIPWIREFDHWIGFEGLLEEYAFDGDAEVDEG